MGDQEGGVGGHGAHFSHEHIKNMSTCGGTSLVIQWLRLCAPNAGGLESIPGLGTASHMLQPRVGMLKLRPGTAK